jgi:hypothetical protein
LSGCILPQQIHPPNSTPLFSRSSGRKLKDTAETRENHKPFLENFHSNFARLSHSSLGKTLLEHRRPGCRSIPAAKFRHSAKLYWCDERAGAHRAHLDTTPNRPAVPARSAGFQTCRIADFQVGKALRITRFAGLETRDQPRTPSGYTDLEVCATGAVSRCARAHTTSMFAGDNFTGRGIVAML